MVVQRGDLACCVRCAGLGAAERLARRQLLKAAVHPPAPGPLSGVKAAGAAVLTGTVLETSPQVITICGPDGERRIALPPGAVVWKGRTAGTAALASGDSVVVRMHPGQRSVADRIWANVGRVTGLIVERGRESLLVDVGRTTRRQAVLTPPYAMGRLQVRFPRLEPGYLVDFIGLRGRGFLEALVPATSQPAYRAGEAPAPVRGHATARIAGSAVWHEATGPADADGVRYPALDPETACLETACLEHPLTGTGCPRLPYLSVGSLLEVRNECTGRARVLPVSGCAATAQIFCDRCLTCGTSPRGRIADLPMASFVAMGGDLERGCFNATVSPGSGSPGSPSPGSLSPGSLSSGPVPAGRS
jgi:hypothetical protein